jgi:hypothetical protein
VASAAGVSSASADSLSSAAALSSGVSLASVVAEVSLDSEPELEEPQAARLNTMDIASNSASNFFIGFSFLLGATNHFKFFSTPSVYILICHFVFVNHF